MRLHWPVIAASVIALVAVDAASATTKKRHHHVPAAPVAVEHGSSFEPPRMVEVRPGVIISTWDCITDEGFGRWRICGSGRK